MTIREQYALLLKLAKELKTHGSWAGETHVQKTAYFLQELLNVPLGFKFVLYKHGPFSFGLRDSLSQMESERFIELKEQPYPYGPSIVPGKAEATLREMAPTTAAFADQVGFVAEKLGPSGVAELERLATALLITKDGQTPRHHYVARLTELKPHVSEPDAQAAFARLNAIQDDAVAQRLVWNSKQDRTTETATILGAGSA